MKQFGKEPPRNLKKQRSRMAREADNIRRRNRTRANFVAARVNANFRARELLVPYLLVGLNLGNPVAHVEGERGGEVVHLEGGGVGEVVHVEGEGGGEVVHGKGEVGEVAHIEVVVGDLILNGQGPALAPGRGCGVDAPGHRQEVEIGPALAPGRGCGVDAAGRGRGVDASGHRQEVEIGPPQFLIGRQDGGVCDRSQAQGLGPVQVSGCGRAGDVPAAVLGAPGRARVGVAPGRHRDLVRVRRPLFLVEWIDRAYESADLLRTPFRPPVPQGPCTPYSPLITPDSPLTPAPPVAQSILAPQPRHTPAAPPTSGHSPAPSTPSALPVSCCSSPCTPALPTPPAPCTPASLIPLASPAYDRSLAWHTRLGLRTSFRPPAPGTPASAAYGRSPAPGTPAPRRRPILLFDWVDAAYKKYSRDSK